jgi:hypothetical protein
VKISSVFLAVCLCATAVGASCQSADLKATLAGITKRGRALYDYDQAAALGTDAIFSLKPKPSTEGLTHYVCVHTPKGWRFVFPKWNAAHDHVVIAYEAVETAPGKFTARKLDPPEEGTKEIQVEELALELAIRDFKKPTRPYNSSVLHASGGNFYVYLYPGQIKADAWPIGGDIRYTISSDGQHIVEKRQLHKSILDAQPKPGSNEVAGYHFHILTDLPEDTDVLYVMNRKPAMPEYIGVEGAKKFFLINIDGSITTAEDKPAAVKPAATDKK